MGPAQSNATIRRQIALYHETLEENGHEIPEDMVIVREFFCAPNRAALDRARGNLARKYEVYAQHGLHGTDTELTRKVTGDLETLMDDTFPDVGSPEECVEQIAAYHEMGFTDVALRLFYPEMSQAEVLEHIDLVGREVIPALHAL